MIKTLFLQRPSFSFTSHHHPLVKTPILKRNMKSKVEFCSQFSETYLGSYQTSMLERFAKWLPLTFNEKKFHHRCMIRSYDLWFSTVFRGYQKRSVHKQRKILKDPLDWSCYGYRGYGTFHFLHRTPFIFEMKYRVI